MTPQNQVENPLSSPFRTKNQTVLGEWIDYNGHMNVAYYTLAFDKALDFFFEDVLNIGPSFVKKNKEGPFALKASYNYFSELLESESFFVDISILDFDSKRVHVFGEMRKDKSLELSAVFETVLMNMDLSARKVKQYPDRVLELFNLFKSSLAKDKIPVEIGKIVVKFFTSKSFSFNPFKGFIFLLLVPATGMASGYGLFFISPSFGTADKRAFV